MTKTVMFIPQKAIEILMNENVTDITFFIVCKINFLLVLTKRSNFLSTLCQRNLKTPQSQAAETLEGQDVIKSKISHAIFHHNNCQTFQLFSLPCLHRVLHSMRQLKATV